MYNFRTDMADERYDMFKESCDENEEISGITSCQKKMNNQINECIVDVCSKEGEKNIGKPMGKYVTFDLKGLKYADEDEIEESAEIISKELKSIIDDKLNYGKEILVVGLGNQYVTPDSLGPKVVNEIEITRHLKKYAPEYVSSECKTISAIAPGVLGTTGIETYEIIKGVIQNIKPDLVIVIDSLASKSIKRISTSIQISNTGITPGSGVENKRKELTFNTLGIPVISIGVPMVVDLATITEECINALVGKIKDESKENKLIEKIKNEYTYDKIKSALIPDDYNMIVTPKEIDELVENMKNIVARSINYALN